MRKLAPMVHWPLHPRWHMSDLRMVQISVLVPVMRFDQYIDVKPSVFVWGTPSEKKPSGEDLFPRFTVTGWRA
eukprot:15478163-Alexandrium_andersonii.AAC.1